MSIKPIIISISVVLLSCNMNVNKEEDYDRLDYRNYTDIIEKECFDIENPVPSGVEFVKIDSGYFTFGCQYNDSSKCQGSLVRHYHTGFVNSFSISKHEITVGQFREFIDETDYKTDAEKNGIGYVWEYVDELDQITIETPFIS